MLQLPTLTPTPSQMSTVTGVFRQIRVDLLAATPRLITAAIVFGIFFIVAQVGQRIIAFAAPRVRADTGAVLLLSRIYYYSVLVFGLITALGTAGLNVSALVAGLGLTGFAFGFALKDVLSNLVSGLMLLVYRPFKIGDQIEMGAYEGTIKTIRMRDTIVRGYDGRMIVIPNTKLITEVVINNSAARLVRDAVAFELTTETDIEVAREIFVRAMIGNATVRGTRRTPRHRAAKIRRPPRAATRRPFLVQPARDGQSRCAERSRRSGQARIRRSRNSCNASAAHPSEQPPARRRRRRR